MMTRGLVVLFLMAAASALANSEVCSPFDKDPANASVVNDHLADGGGLFGPDITMCCKGGAGGCIQRCPHTQAGQPVDTLTGFAWLDRTDIQLAQPWGPPVAFRRHYSTADAERAERTVVGPGWRHTYSGFLALAGPNPATRVILVLGERTSEEFNLVGGAYTTNHAARTMTWDSTTNLYVAGREDGSAFVFDGTGALRVIRTADGGEAQLRYANDDAACAVSQQMPVGALCRVDFLFGRQLWFAYEATGSLAGVALDAKFTTPVAMFDYFADGSLWHATAADGNAETYAYGFTHIAWASQSQVSLLTQATDADGKLVEAFQYHAAPDDAARVVTHQTPTGDYTFTWNYLTGGVLSRTTSVRSNRENIDLTFANNALVSECFVDSQGNCDTSRLHTYVTAPDILEMQCDREGSGNFNRHERDGQGRIIAEYSGLPSCSPVTAAAYAHGERYGYLGGTGIRASTSFVSVDPTMPGFNSFTLSDYTTPSSAIDAYCGGATCQTPAAFNAGPLSPQVQRLISVGRTLVDVDGTWGTQVQVTTKTYDSSGRLATEDGPRRDVSDVTTFGWNSASPWALASMTPPGRAATTYADFDVRGRPHTVTDEAGQVWAMGYDAVGRMTSTQAPGLTASTILSYLPSGRLGSATDPNGSVSQVGYDTDGQLESVSRLPGAASSLPDSTDTYGHSRKLLAGISHSDGYAILQQGFDFDSQGRTTTTLSFGPSNGSAVGIDDDNRMVWRADPGRFDPAATTQTQSHHYTYDEFGMLTRVDQLIGGNWVVSASYTWDSRGNLASFTDTKSVTIRYQHDDFGRLVEVQSPDFGLSRFVYDEAGNLIKERRPDGAVLQYTYDAANRLVSVSDGSKVRQTWTFGSAAPVVSNCADGAALPAPLGGGRVTQVSDDVGDWYFGYWPNGTQRYESLVAAGATCGKTLSWEYDSTGLLTAMVYPSGARVEYGYPAAGEQYHEQPSTLTLVMGATRTTMLTNIGWGAGEVSAYTTPAGSWSLSRNMDGTPASVSLDTIRAQHFGSFEPWGSPGSDQETFWGDSTGAPSVFSHSDLPALTSATNAAYSPQAYAYLASGDRSWSNGAAWCYERGTHRLALINGQSRFSYTPAGAASQRQNLDGTVSTWCYGAMGELASTVGGGGDINDIVTNFRRQRTIERWPVNGLQEDFRVDESSRLLVHAGVASLTAQYPRPTREYVWLGQHPVAVIESSEAATGMTTPMGVTYLTSGQLGEVLVESTDTGGTLRQYGYTPFGERHEVLPSATAEVATTVTFASPPGVTAVLGGLSGDPTARALQLHFTDAALVGCTINVRSSTRSPSWLGQYAITLGGVTDWLPSTELLFELVGCPQAVSGDYLVGLRTDLGLTRTTLHYEATTQPYPAAGQQFRLNLAEPSYVQLSSAAVASCDKIEVRTPAGVVLWQWKPGGVNYFGFFMADSQAITPKLQGAVDIGIWGAGCNAAERQSGFSITSAIAEESADSVAPVVVGLPGQKYRADGTVDNWFRPYDTGLGRYLEPEPMLQNPGYVSAVASRGMSVPTYAYAASNPLRFVDRDGLTIFPDLADPQVMALVKKLQGTPCGKKLWDYLDGLQGVDFWIYQDSLRPNPDLTWPAGDTERIGNDIRIRLDFFNMMVGNENPLTALGHEFGHGLLLTIPYPIRYWDPRAKGRVLAQHEAFARELARCIQEEKCGK